MTDCPNCGEPADDGYCWACGSEVDAAGSGDDDAETDRSAPSGAAEPSAEETADRRSGTAANAASDPDPPAAQQASPTETDRRSVLTYGAVGAALVGGWYVFVRDSSSDPESVVADYYAAIDTGDVDGVNALLHEDAPQGEVTESDLAYADEFTLTVESTVERSADADDETVVEAEVTVDEEGEESETIREELYLQQQDGDWRIYDISFDGRVD